MASNEKDLLIGTWRSPDVLSSVVIHIAKANGQYQVSATDEDDGEKAEVYDVKEEGGDLCFATHWPSNGRLTKFRFLVTAEGVANVTFTYSEKETWLKSRP